MLLLLFILFSLSAGSFAATDRSPDGFVTTNQLKYHLSKNTYASIVNDSYGRPLHFGASFFYSIQNRGSRLYQTMTPRGLKVMTPVLDRYNASNFGEINFINRTGNYHDYIFWTHCGNGCSGSLVTVSQLGTQLSRNEQAHPFYNYYWLQKAEYSPIGQYLADFNNNTWGYCSNCNGEELRTQWEIKLHPDIKLNGRLYDFVIQWPSDEVILSSITKVAVESELIVNQGNQTLTRTIERHFMSPQGYRQLSFTGSLKDSFSRFDLLTANIDQSISLKNATINLQMRNVHSQSPLSTKAPSFNVPDIIWYEQNVKEQINVAPNSIVQVQSFINWADELVIPFTAKLRVTGNDVRLSYSDKPGVGTLLPEEMSSYGIQNLLDIYRINETLISSTTNSRTYRISGVIQGSFALFGQINSIGIS